VAEAMPPDRPGSTVSPRRDSGESIAEGETCLDRGDRRHSRRGKVETDVMVDAESDGKLNQLDGQGVFGCCAPLNLQTAINLDCRCRPGGRRPRIAREPTSVVSRDL